MVPRIRVYLHAGGWSLRRQARGYCELPCNGGQLQNIVRRAEETPFSCHLRLPAEKELPEAPCVFDLPEDGFDGVFSQPVSGAKAALSQSSVHLLSVFGQFAGSGSRGRLSMFQFSGCHIAADVSAREFFQIIVGEVSRISR